MRYISIIFWWAASCFFFGTGLFVGGVFMAKDSAFAVGGLLLMVISSLFMGFFSYLSEKELELKGEG